jgi:hypothetical protein
MGHMFIATNVDNDAGIMIQIRRVSSSMEWRERGFSIAHCHADVGRKRDIGTV